MGFSKFISFGNKADVNEIDLLDYLAKDQKTAVIAMYLEDVTNGRRFIETVRKIFWETHKPMLCLKSGRSPEGAKAVSSHTGSLAGSDSVYDALLMQSGVQRVDTIAELFDYAALYTTQPLPRGGRVAIITNAGGPGIMATDAAVRHGLKLAELSGHQGEAQGSLPADRLAAQSDRRDRRCPRRPLPGGRPHGAGRRERRHGHRHPHAAVDDRHRRDGGRRARGRARASTSRSSARSWGPRTWPPGVNILRKAGIPNYPFPEDGVRAWPPPIGWSRCTKFPAARCRSSTTSTSRRPRQLIAEALDGHDKRYLTQAECRPLLECYRLPLLSSAVVHRRPTRRPQAADVVRMRRW